MMQLRWYQQRALQQLGQTFRNGARSTVLVAPTGAGKTIMMSHLALAVRGGDTVPIPTVRERAEALRNPPQARLLVLVHRRELLKQTVDKFRRNGIQEVGVISAKYPNMYPTAPIQVASIQTLTSRSRRNGEAATLPPARFLVLDECHHYAAEEWRNIIEFYRDARIIGFTATPERGDGRPLGAGEDGLGFQEMVVAAQPRELIADNFLTPCEIIAPGSTQEAGTIAWSPVEANRRFAAGRRTIIFCESIPVCEQYAAELTALGVAAAVLHHKLNQKQRDATLSAFENGQIEVLLNVAILTEGYDSPGVEVVQIARGVGTAGLYIQMVGRGLRPAPGKGSALLIDQRGIVHLYGMPDADREYSLRGRPMRVREGEAVSSNCAGCGGLFVRGMKECPHCGRPVMSSGEGGPRMEITSERLSQIVSIRKDPETIRAYFALIVRARSEARDRRWVNEQFRSRTGGWPMAQWWDWYEAGAAGRWDDVPELGREAAARAGLRA